MPSLNKSKNDFRQLVDYSNSYKVPVAVTEIAVVNPCEGYGPLQKDITKYAEMAYESISTQWNRHDFLGSREASCLPIKELKVAAMIFLTKN